MLVRVHSNAGLRPYSRELDVLAGHSVFCSEFTYRRGSEIFGEAEPADYSYEVLGGAVRSYRLLSDGRRQINAFHLPGDIFGVENGDAHRFTAEAIIETTARLTRRQSILNEIAHGKAAATANVLNLITRNLQHAESHMLLLGRKTSLEKVAAFLMEMDGRFTATGTIILPMSRRDIADYLGLTLETVSRVLSNLRDQGVITFMGQTQRQIVLLDRRKLAELN
jgi:CRP/FNR family nitrogen fixation transcriptional regulator